MTSPTIACTYCGRVRDVMQHVRADFPPDAARKWMKRTCKHEEKPCDFGYRAGVDVVGIRRALKDKQVTE
jgi:hypothetical protein